MALRCYSYITKRHTALLDESEWAEIEPLLNDWLGSIKEYRAATGADLDTARAKHARAVDAERRYAQLTGDTVDHPDQLWKLRMSQYGALCPKCDRPFRTPKSRLCAECGYQLANNQTAGSLDYPKGKR